jgi:hypothetical protein
MQINASGMIEFIGLLAVCSMVACYAWEDRSPALTLAFAASCAVAAFYAFLIGSYPFMFAEGIWAIIAFRKWRVRIENTVP